MTPLDCAVTGRGSRQVIEKQVSRESCKLSNFFNNEDGNKGSKRTIWARIKLTRIGPQFLDMAEDGFVLAKAFFEVHSGQERRSRVQILRLIFNQLLKSAFAILARKLFLN